MVGTDLITEKEYREMKFNSYSSLKDFSLDRRKYYRKWILKEKIKEKDSQASVMGRLVETLLMEPDRFDDLFFMSTCVKVPGGMLGDFIYHLAVIISEHTDDSGELKGDFEEHAMEAYRKSGFKIAPKTVMKKLDDPENTLYYEECLKTEYYGMTMVTAQDVDNAEKIVNALKEGMATSHIVNLEDSDRYSVYNQLKISEYEIDGMGLKSMLDKVIADHYKKAMYIFDLKCTWNVENFYKDYYLYRRSYIQAFLYYRAVKHWTEIPGSPIEGYEVKLPKFIVCDSINYYDPLVYELTNLDLDEAYNGFTYQGKHYTGVRQIIEELKWAINEDIWTMSKNNYVKKGTILLKP